MLTNIKSSHHAKLMHLHLRIITFPHADAFAMNRITKLTLVLERPTHLIDFLISNLWNGDDDGDYDDNDDDVDIFLKWCSCQHV